MPAPNEGTQNLPSDNNSRYFVGWWDTVTGTFKAPRGNEVAGLFVQGQAGENHLGEIGGNSDVIPLALTVTAGAYTAGMVVGGKQTVTAAMRLSNGKGFIDHIALRDTSNQKAPLNILVFNADPTSGTYTDHAAYAANGTDMGKYQGLIKVLASDWETLGTECLADVDVKKIVEANGGNSNLYLIIVTPGTPTFGSTSALSLSVAMGRD